MRNRLLDSVRLLMHENSLDLHPSTSLSQQHFACRNPLTSRLRHPTCLQLHPAGGLTTRCCPLIEQPVHTFRLREVARAHVEEIGRYLAEVLQHDFHPAPGKRQPSHAAGNQLCARCRGLGFLQRQRLWTCLPQKAIYAVAAAGELVWRKHHQGKLHRAWLHLPAHAQGKPYLYAFPIHNGLVGELGIDIGNTPGDGDTVALHLRGQSGEVRLREVRPCVVRLEQRKPTAGDNGQAFIAHLQPVRTEPCLVIARPRRHIACSSTQRENHHP
ncbi:hypothetical protein HRbin16_01056 [bacterium HR16]|nr:hypothetical protein HRbin16_01056 [bacterium HR16]